MNKLPLPPPRRRVTVHIWDRRTGAASTRITGKVGRCTAQRWDIGGQLIRPRSIVGWTAPVHDLPLSA